MCMRGVACGLPEDKTVMACEELALNLISAVTNITFYCTRGGAGLDSLTSRLVQALAPCLEHPNPEVREAVCSGPWLRWGSGVWCVVWCVWCGVCGVVCV